MIGVGARCGACDAVLGEGRAYEFGADDGSTMALCRSCAVACLPWLVALVDGAANACPECRTLAGSRADPTRHRHEVRGGGRAD